LDFKSPCIIQQGNGNDCGLASIANAISFVKHFKQVDFIKSSTEISGTTGEVHYHLVNNIAPLDYFFHAIMQDGQTMFHYPQLFDTNTLLIHMREEFTKLVDRIASDSVTDEKLFTEVKKAMPKVNLYYDLQDLQDLQDINMEQQEAANIMASLVESSPTLHPTESRKSAIVSPTQSNLAESSTSAEASKTTSNEATCTQESKKKRRKSVHQVQRCKRMRYVLPMNKPPLKKPRRSLVSTKKRKEEKEKAKKFNDDALAYIGQAVCSAGREGCYHDGQQNIWIEGKNKNGSECCTCKKNFMMFVFMYTMESCFACNVTNKMWWPNAKQRHYSMMFLKLTSCQKEHHSLIA
jgi:hypothetical protein